jgi:hypothetical protein
MGIRTFVSFAALAMIVPSTAAAQGMSASGHVGTLGIGADVSIGILPRVALRAGANVQPWKPKREIDDIDFELTLPSPSFLGAVDIRLLGPLRISGGLVSFGSDIEVTGQLTEDVEIGDATYSPEQIGALSGLFETRSLAPWVGIGLAKSVGPGVGFLLDLGVAFTGEPDVSLSASGPIANDPTFQANLRQEEQNLQDDAKLVKLYPIVSIGMSIGW